MQRHRNHQIDELAQQVLRTKLPTTWVINDLHRDYGKDFQIEIGEDSGTLTGSSFYVQLKGQEAASFNKNKTYVSYSLERKHAEYFLDKVTDLPVFLVVVDVGHKCGWFVHVQQALFVDQSWRKQNKARIRLPVANDIADTLHLKQAIHEAKRQMQLLHPAAIKDAIAAQKKQFLELDARFEPHLFVTDDGSASFKLRSKGSVELKFENLAHSQPVESKLSDLIDRGLQVAFAPGEVRVSGSKLFEQFEHTGGEIQHQIIRVGAVSVIAKDEDKSELSRIDDIPGEFTGGAKELRFTGGLPNSPLTLSMNPIAPNTGGAANFNVSLTKWDGQRIMQLAYFDRIHRLLSGLARCAFTESVCLIDGNQLFSAESRTSHAAKLNSLVTFLTMVDRARKVCGHAKINPTWTTSAFSRRQQAIACEAHAILFEGGWEQGCASMRMDLGPNDEAYSREMLDKLQTPCGLMFVQRCDYDLLGHNIDVGRLCYEFTHVFVEEQKSEPNRKGGRRGRRHKTGQGVGQLTLVGTPDTRMRVRPAKDDE